MTNIKISVLIVIIGLLYIVRRIDKCEMTVTGFLSIFDEEHQVFMKCIVSLDNFNIHFLTSFHL